MICCLSSLGILKIAGNDAKKFLQGQLTCDLNKITSQYSSLAAHCNPQGRVVSLFYICLFNHDYYLIMHPDMVPLTIKVLKKFSVFYKVELSDVTTTMNIARSSNKPPHSISILIPGPELRYLVLTESSEQIKNSITENTWHFQNLCAKLATIYPETSAKFLPHELGLIDLGAVDFDKGCYTGQEIIARMHYRGKLKNHLHLVSSTCDLKPELGAPIFTSYEQSFQEAGCIVDFCEYNLELFILVITNDLHIQNLFLDSELTTRLIPFNINPL